MAPLRAGINPVSMAARLGAPGERVAGFFFFGTAAKPLEERPRPEPGAVVRHWTG